LPEVKNLTLYAKEWVSLAEKIPIAARKRAIQIEKTNKKSNITGKVMSCCKKTA